MDDAQRPQATRWQQHHKLNPEWGGGDKNVKTLFLADRLLTRGTETHLSIISQPGEIRNYNNHTRRRLADTQQGRDHQNKKDETIVISQYPAINQTLSLTKQMKSEINHTPRHCVHFFGREDYYPFVSLK